ncbi:MAG: hypothetical protein MJB12_04325 [Firmicutes bacterium]|nr:hypothetical protein [Bacillota bacterium]
MNKYMGFYELKDINIPTVPWKPFTEHTILDTHLLWTLRAAVENSNDLNLPRVVGVRAEEAYEKGKVFLSKYGDHGLVVYYPYFIAEKSGVLEVNRERVVIEAVDKDLWNLVTYGQKNVTVILSKDETRYIGEPSFMSQEELQTLQKYANVIKYRFRDVLNEGKSIFAEWSFAYNTDIHHQPIGDQYLVFYELRSVR